MELLTFDFEVFSHDWLVVFKNMKSNVISVVHNNPDKLRSFVKSKNIYVGWNNSRYDNYIMTAILHGATVREVKSLNDWIIDDNKPWEHYTVKYKRREFKFIDLMQDENMLSLKRASGNMGYNIQETEVDFNIDRPLTEEELKKTIKYAVNDVDVTSKLFDVKFRSKIQPKVFNAKRVGLDVFKSIGQTNGNLIADYMGAEKMTYDDERTLMLSKNINMDIIPQSIKDFFNRWEDDSIPTEKFLKAPENKEEFDYRFHIENIEGVDIKYALGGVHGARPKYMEESNDERVIILDDVTSFYPFIMINENLYSRSWKYPERLEIAVHDRIEAKEKGDKVVSNALKLPINTAYGISLATFNRSYDARQGRNVCFNGQLLLTDLYLHMREATSSLKLINFNTDGVMYSIKRSEIKRIDTATREWENRTGYMLTREYIDGIYQKDVNNYIYVDVDDRITAIGGWVKQWNGGNMTSNSGTIIHRAIVEFFVHGTPVEETIKSANNILDFQFITNAGSMYHERFHTINGKKTPVQKVNRTYATNLPGYETIYHVKTNKRGELQYNKAPSIPDNVFIDNTGTEMSFDKLDYNWYIEEAKRKINLFGAKEWGINP
ncbi:MAG TPA: hypothetical protein VFC79_06915 [Tissierellaceae bacterium]|nr:hypothetical protein [Tissierellaceae bacterium]